MLIACSNSNDVGEFDYSRFAHVDAESLCESGIEEAYQIISPELNQLSKPETISRVQTNSDDYIIRFRDTNYPVYNHDSNMSVTDCWHQASYVFFHIVNSQIINSDKKFYAYGWGNDLHGGFLTKEDVAQIKAENDFSDHAWPYIPKNQNIIATTEKPITAPMARDEK